MTLLVIVLIKLIYLPTHYQSTKKPIHKHNHVPHNLIYKQHKRNILNEQDTKDPSNL